MSRYGYGCIEFKSAIPRLNAFTTRATTNSVSYQWWTAI